MCWAPWSSRRSRGGAAGGEILVVLLVVEHPAGSRLRLTPRCATCCWPPFRGTQWRISALSAWRRGRRDELYCCYCLETLSMFAGTQNNQIRSVEAALHKSWSIFKFVI